MPCAAFPHSKADGSERPKVSTRWEPKLMHSFDDFSGIVRTDEPLAHRVWFRLGGPAAYFASPRTLDELVALLKRCRDEDIALKILGGGSNVLVRDEGVRALVILLESPFFSDITGARSCRGGRRRGSPHRTDLPLGAGGIGRPGNPHGHPGYCGRGASAATPGADRAPSDSSSAVLRYWIRAMRSWSASATT